MGRPHPHGHSSTNMSSPDEVVIVSAVRTPIGDFNGGLAKVPAHQLGSTVIAAALERANISKDDDKVSEVIMGQVLLGGCKMNPARQAAVGAGLPYAVPAMNVSMVCGSGLRAVMLGRNSILAGDSTVVVAGGQESMSRAVHAVRMREGCKFGDQSLADTMLSDGLTDAFLGCHMGVTAENVAERWGVTREEQDAFAAESQRRAAEAAAAGAFAAELVPVRVPGRKPGQETVVDRDLFPKPDTTAEGLAKLRPAFVPGGAGTVTAGNASGINDGAACVVLMSAAEAGRRGLAPLASIVATATAGIGPEVMGMGPIGAIRKALGIAGWSTETVDLWELNEAFAAPSVAINRELGLDESKVNVSGGSIALGHPIGASGCRILVTLLHGLARRGAHRGCAALCIGGGMGLAVCVERRAN